MKKVHDKALLSGKDEVSCYHRYKFDMEYDSIIKTAYGENPLPETSAKKRGRKKKSKVLKTIDEYEKQLYNQREIFDRRACHDFGIVRGLRAASPAEGEPVQIIRKFLPDQPVLR